MEESTLREKKLEHITLFRFYYKLNAGDFKLILRSEAQSQKFFNFSLKLYNPKKAKEKLKAFTTLAAVEFNWK